MGDKELNKYLNKMKEYAENLSASSTSPREALDSLIKAGICEPNGKIKEPYNKK